MNEETFYKIKLDLVHNTINNFVHVMQYDDGVAYIRAEIYKDWQHVYPSEEFDSAELRLKKHDGAWIKCNSVEPYIPVAKPSYEKAKTDGVYYYYQNGNYILVTSSMTEQAYDALDPNLFYKNVGTIISLEHDYVKINVVEELTDIPGGCPAVIDLYSADGHIQTAKFVLDVDRNPIQTGEAVKNVPEDVSAKLSEMSKGIANAVKVTPQTLTDEEKAQARENIGVGSSDLNIENGTGLKSLQGKIQEGKETFNTNIDGQTHTSGASGDYSVLFGGVGEASGKRSTALGGYNVAEGDDALAAGEATKATGRGSTTEGGETSAFGDYSHAEGTETICAAVSAHVEGGSSIVGVNSKFGHAEGVNNTVTDFVPNQSTTPKPTENTQPNANAGTTAPTPENTKPSAGNTETPGISGIGDYSGFGAHAEGGYNIANGIYSHVEGYKNTALFPYAHAEGSHTYAKGRAAHSEGYFVEANHAGSHAEGAYTKTGKDYQHVSGLYNIGKENTLFEVGNGNASVRKNAFEVYSDGHAEVQTQGTTEKSVAQVKFVQDYVENELNSYLPQIRLSSSQVTRPMSRVVHDTYTEHKITFQITTEQASYIEDNSKPVIKLQLSQHIPYIDGDYLYLQRNVIQTLSEREVIQFTFNNARFNFDEALTQGYVPMTEIGDGAAIYDKSTKTLFVSFVETSPKKVEDAIASGGEKLYRQKIRLANSYYPDNKVLYVYTTKATALEFNDFITVDNYVKNVKKVFVINGIFQDECRYHLDLGIDQFAFYDLADNNSVVTAQIWMNDIQVLEIKEV